MIGAIAGGSAATVEAGARVLEAGGNAVDAAVAAAFAAFVSEPMLAAAGGAGVLVGGSPDQGFEIVDFFCRMPGLSGDGPAELDFRAIEIDFGATTQIFHIGRGAATAPTALAGLLCAHRRMGYLPLREVASPAVGLAKEGTVMGPAVAWVTNLLRPIVTNSLATRQLYAGGNDGVLGDGDLHANPELGAVLLEASRTGLDPLTRGDLVPTLLSEFGPPSGGLITETDLRDYAPQLREPITFDFRGRSVLTNSPPSSGGRLIAATLAALENAPDHGPFFSERHLLDLASAMSDVSRLRNELGLPALGSTTHISVLAGDQAASLTLSNGEGCGEVLPGTGIQMNNFLGEEDINPLGFHTLAPGTWMSTMMAPTLVLDGDGRPELVLGSGGSNRLRNAIAQVVLNVEGFGVPLQEAVEASRLHVEGDHLWYENLALEHGAVLEAAYPECSPFERRSMFFGGVHAVRRVADGYEVAGDPRRGGVARVVE